MTDFIKKYKKEKMISNIGIVFAALVFAIGLNIFLVDGTNIGNNLKANVLETKTNNRASDIFIEQKENNFVLKNNQSMKDVKSFSFSLSYNPEKIDLTDVYSQYGETLLMNNTPGLATIILSLDSPNDINTLSSIVQFKLTNKGESIENINLFQTHFQDSNNDIFELSTTGISI